MDNAIKVTASEWDAAERGCYMALATLESAGVAPSTHEVVNVEEFEVPSKRGNYTLTSISYTVAPKHADEALWNVAGGWDASWA